MGRFFGVSVAWDAFKWLFSNTGCSFCRCVPMATTDGSSGFIDCGARMSKSVPSTPGTQHAYYSGCDAFRMQCRLPRTLLCSASTPCGGFEAFPFLGLKGGFWKESTKLDWPGHVTCMIIRAYIWQTFWLTMPPCPAANIRPSLHRTLTCTHSFVPCSCQVDLLPEHDAQHRWGR
jgi:hypothetical protein